MWITTRFAPSPTGALHIGHAASAIAAHDFARDAGGSFLLRIEDIDGTRSRPEHVQTILDDLAWLGLAWDGPVAFQSERLARYEAALGKLRAMDLLYPCFCTRAEIAREVAASLSAPHGPEGPLYPGTCRRLSEAERAKRLARGEPHCWRLDMQRALQLLPELVSGRGTICAANGGGSFGSNMPRMFEDRPGDDPTRNSREDAAGDFSASASAPSAHPSTTAFGGGPPPPDKLGEELELRRSTPLTWHDAHAGTIIADPLSQGDVVLARKDAPASYHLAVTVDDAAQGVTHVVRGKDLFEATHVHRLLQALLGLPTPEYRHHPLLTDAAGNRLAKRNGAPTLASLRASGMDGRALAADLRAGRLPPGFGRVNGPA